MMNLTNIHNFQNSDELTLELANKIKEDLLCAINYKQRASLVLSGGNTPKKLFEKLSLYDIPWENVIVSLCDERWVSTKDTNSNEHLVKKYFLKNYAKKATFIGMYNERLSLKEASTAYNQKLYEEILLIDVIVLGMGEDGHTASLFPNHKKLETALDLEDSNLCVDIENSPINRLSLSKKAILSAKNIYLHIEGKKKKEVLQKALNSEYFYKYPIASILKQDIKKVEVYSCE